MNTEDQKMVSDIIADIERRRIDLAALDVYRERLVMCNSFEALRDIIVERADYINRQIKAKIKRDQAILNEFLEADKAMMIVETES